MKNYLPLAKSEVFRNMCSSTDPFFDYTNRDIKRWNKELDEIKAESIVYMIRTRPNLKPGAIVVSKEFDDEQRPFEFVGYEGLLAVLRPLYPGKIRQLFARVCSPLFGELISADPLKLREAKILEKLAFIGEGYYLDIDDDDE